MSKQESNRRYYAKNKDKHSEAMKKNYEEHRKEYLLRSEKRRSDAPDKIKEYNKMYYSKNKEELKRKRRERYLKQKKIREEGVGE